jgi:hypothetical protein
LNDPGKFCDDVAVVLKDDGVFVLSFPPRTNPKGNHKWKRINRKLLDEWLDKFIYFVEVIEDKNRWIVTCRVK